MASDSLEMVTYDLSHRIETDMTTYPGDPDVSVDPQATHADDGCRVSSVAMGSHTGTHVDAPSHTEAGGSDLDAFDVGTFVFEARVVSLDKDPREPITTADLAEGVSASATDDSVEDDGSASDTDPTDDADCLLLHTGWDTRWNTDAYLDYPYLTPEAAAWCAERDYHIGVDALNVDPTPSANATADEPAGFAVHHVLLGDERLIIENLRGLDAVPTRFRLYAFPLALADADGAPVRAVAVA